jgi:hypothetical protein
MSPKEYPGENIKNVNVNDRFKALEETEGITDREVQAQALVLDILDVCKDHHSTGAYLAVARTMPPSLVHLALSETKDARARGRIRKSAGAFFMDSIRRLADQQGIELGLSGGSPTTAPPTPSNA